MTVASANSYIQYAGDGVTKTFAAPFYFLLNSDIAVQISDAAGNVTDLVNGTNFSVTGAGNAGGGSVTLNVAYATGYTILVYRNPPVTQETVYYENGKFPAKSHEKALDKLTMLIQKFGWLFDVLALKKPSILAKYYDAKGNRIANLADPVNAQDATTKAYVDGVDGNLQSQITANLLRSLRVPEAGVGVLPSATARRDSILGFNSNGDPVPIFAQTATADLALKLASSEAGLGPSLLGFKRQKLADYISTAQKALDGGGVMVNEFANLITFKPSSDPQTWDWSPAFQALANYCISYVSQTAVQATMFGAKEALMGPGVHPIYSTITVTQYGTSAGSLQTVFRLRGAGRTSSVIQPMTAGMTGFIASKCSVIFDDCGMRSGAANQIPYQLGLKDTWAPVAHAIFDRFGTSGFTCGGLIYLCFDSTFKDCFWQNIQAASDLSGSFGVRVATYEGPANGGTSGDGSGDNTNQLLFIRPTIETSGDDTILLSVEGKSSSYPHHAVTLIGGHLETHNLKSKLIHLKNVYHFQAYGTVFSQNGSSTGITQMYRLGYFENVQNVTIDRCRMVTTNRLASYSDTDTKMIAVVGTCQNLVFDRTHFIGPYNDINAGKHRADYLFDYSGASKGKRSFVLNACTFGDYLSRPITTILRISDLSGVNDYRWNVDETTGAISMHYSTNFTDNVDGSMLWQVTPAGIWKTPGNIQIGALSSSAATRGIDFVNSGDGSTVVGFIRSDSAGRIYTSSFGQTQQWVQGGTSINPTTAGSFSIGTSTLYPSNIYSQNAVTVVSDDNYKSNKRVLTEDEEFKTLISAVCSVSFKAWQLNTAIAEKGKDKARWHVGVIAQQVRDAITAAGLDWTKYGLITFQETEQLVVISPEGNYYPYTEEDDGPRSSDIPVNDEGYIDEIAGADNVIANDDGTALYKREIYMMRMDEFLTLRMAGLENKNQS